MKQVKTPYLFVYGTLKKGFYNSSAKALRRQSLYVEDSKIIGTLHSMGQYPCLKLHKRGKIVVGELYKLKNTEKSLRMLDRYEEAYLFGDDYNREIVPVKTKIGKVVLASVYVYRNKSSHLPVIKTGIFIQ